MLPEIITSQITKAERWLKLYRVIHHLFLRQEFPHIQDYNRAIDEINAKIATLEANINQSIQNAVQQISIAVQGHTHIVPQTPAGVTTSSPGMLTAPPIFSPVPSTPKVIPLTVFMELADSALMGTGPAVAPLASGVAPDQVVANSTIVADIGF